MHFSESPGFVVNTVAMIIQIVDASRLCIDADAGGIADSIILVTTEVRGSSFASFHWSSMPSN